MSFLKEMFGTEKPILGLLHLKPLPGDPFYAPHGSLDDVIACARADLDALQSGGVDGVLVTNELSIPYEKKVSGVTLGAMGMVVGALKEHFTVPYGVEAFTKAMPPWRFAPPRAQPSPAACSRAPGRAIWAW